MKEWFLSLSQREKVMVQLATAVVLVFLVYLIILEPLASSYSSSKQNVVLAEKSLEWMKTAAQEIKQLRGNGAVAERPNDKQSVLSLVDSSVRKAGLAAVMKRVQPEGDSGVRVWFENAIFDEIVHWLATIESEHGLLVNEINIEQAEATGLVHVRVFLN